MRRQVRWMAVLALVVAGFALPGEAIGAQAPPGPPVGLLPVPDPLPPGAPGSVIDEAPFAVDAHPFAVEGHQLLYRSTDRFGAGIAVSGALLVPTGVPAPPGGRPVVAVPHGTTGITDGCAPSIDVQHSGNVVYDDVQALLAGGAVVVATDYPGMGGPGVHPYLDGISEARAVLDSIRAARDFGGTGPAAISGMSQGGHATLYAGAEHATYAPDIDLRGIAPVAAPTLMSAAYAAREASGNAGAYVGIIINGIVAARPDLDRSELLTQSGLDAFAALEAADAAGECSYGEIDVERDVRADPLTLPAWNAAMKENEPGDRAVDVPVLMVASEGDSTVPPYMTELICAGLTRLDTDLRVWMYDDEDHVGVSIESAPDRATWLLGVLAGDPPARTVDWIGEEPEVIDSCATPALPPTVDPDPDPVPADPPPPAAPARPVRTAARFTG